jgi:hypothetical protein
MASNQWDGKRLADIEAKCSTFLHFGVGEEQREIAAACASLCFEMRKLWGDAEVKAQAMSNLRGGLLTMAEMVRHADSEEKREQLASMLEDAMSVENEPTIIH